MQCGTLDWALEQKEGNSAKTGEIQIQYAFSLIVMFWCQLFTYSKRTWYCEDINQICSGNTIYRSLGLRLYLQIVWKSLTNSVVSRFIIGTMQDKRAKIDLRFNPVQVGQASLVLWVSVFLLVKQYWRCPLKVSSLTIPRSTGSLVT